MKIPPASLLAFIIVNSTACADDTVCAQVITIAKNKQGICRVFKDACVPTEYAATDPRDCDCDKLEFSPDLSKEFQTSYCKDTAANRDIFMPRIIGQEPTK
jgi:hypothetical protein